MNTDDYFENLNSPIKEISIELRRIVTTFSPELKEEIKWGVPTYSINKNICSIIAHKRHVNFQIMQGAHIGNIDTLEGTGKDMRHMKFLSLHEINQATVEKCLMQAIALDK
jgi:hypothetical protein